MNKFKALELLRLVTFLPLIVVLVAMAADGRDNTALYSEQIASNKQLKHYPHIRES